MKEFMLIVKNESGLHARPASLLAEKAQTYSSELTIIHEGTEIDAKSIVSILCGGIGPGMEIKVITDGEDEEEALAGIVGLISSFTE